jgi:hypothetical protein
MAKRRKPRSDRNHVIYKITHKDTGDIYIGITVVRGRAFNRSLKLRWEGHCYKAFVELKTWTLPTSIREHGAHSFVKEILEVVRGKASAHKREVELINSLQPALNTKKALVA